jgi:hypothetical protein
MSTKDLIFIFNQVQFYFSNYLLKYTPDDIVKNINFCGYSNEEDFLIEMVKQLKEVYPNMSTKDLCICIIYTYYSLNLIEPSTNIMNQTMFKKVANNPKNVYILYLKITIGDIIFKGKNLSSSIRKIMQKGERAVEK